jgi:hypothetical protein
MLFGGFIHLNVMNWETPKAVPRQSKSERHTTKWVIGWFPFIKQQ